MTLLIVITAQEVLRQIIKLFYSELERSTLYNVYLPQNIQTKPVPGKIIGNKSNSHSCVGVAKTKLHHPVGVVQIFSATTQIQ